MIKNCCWMAHIIDVKKAGTTGLFFVLWQLKIGSQVKVERKSYLCYYISDKECLLHKRRKLFNSLLAAKIKQSRSCTLQNAR